MHLQHPTTYRLAGLRVILDVRLVDGYGGWRLRCRHRLRARRSLRGVRATSTPVEGEFRILSAKRSKLVKILCKTHSLVGALAPQVQLNPLRAAPILKGETAYTCKKIFQLEISSQMKTS